MNFFNLAKKSLGQNFLIDQNIINKIIKIGKITENKTVLEIGPGYGNLTKKIANMKPKKILAIEKDEKLVLFLKNINDNLKTSLISESNLFLMPSRIEKKSVEGFGISFIEAAQQGTPSIGGKDGGAVDSILHEETGLICDGNDLNSIYESVLKILENNKYN